MSLKIVKKVKAKKQVGRKGNTVALKFDKETKKDKPSKKYVV